LKFDYIFICDSFCFFCKSCYWKDLPICSETSVKRHWQARRDGILRLVAAHLIDRFYLMARVDYSAFYGAVITHDFDFHFMTRKTSLDAISFSMWSMSGMLLVLLFSGHIWAKLTFDILLLSRSEPQAASKTPTGTHPCGCQPMLQHFSGLRPSVSFSFWADCETVNMFFFVPAGLLSN